MDRSDYARRWLRTGATRQLSRCPGTIHTKARPKRGHWGPFPRSHAATRTQCRTPGRPRLRLRGVPAGGDRVEGPSPADPTRVLHPGRSADGPAVRCRRLRPLVSAVDGNKPRHRLLQRHGRSLWYIQRYVGFMVLGFGDVRLGPRARRPAGLVRPSLHLVRGHGEHRHRRPPRRRACQQASYCQHDDGLRARRC
jgi:hypothetical protein